MPVTFVEHVRLLFKASPVIGKDREVSMSRLVEILS